MAAQEAASSPQVPVYGHETVKPVRRRSAADRVIAIMIGTSAALFCWWTAN
ncbi:hypothetical protein [Croceicoccus marinus]|uniref:hypothetical protein n=1 Tax=Croceicoccus marinus TaxID=450378 RepID=UPI000B00A9A3|nr:hypothetical protein [Croceicoccus marinus]